jgi:hypothetical protein
VDVGIGNNRIGEHCIILLEKYGIDLRNRREKKKNK